MLGGDSGKSVQEEGDVGEGGEGGGRRQALRLGVSELLTDLVDWLPRSLHYTAGAPNCGAKEKPAAPVWMTDEEKANPRAQPLRLRSGQAGIIPQSTRDGAAVAVPPERGGGERILALGGWSCDRTATVFGRRGLREELTERREQTARQIQ